MAKFEVVSRFADSGIQVPVASTKNSAGYDFVVAEDIIVPAYEDLCAMMTYSSQASILDILNACESNAGIESLTYTLDELAKLIIEENTQILGADIAESAIEKVDKEKEEGGTKDNVKKEKTKRTRKTKTA